ncbi:hypothetical protein Tco_1505378 [Tanacetum coccineum]
MTPLPQHHRTTTITPQSDRLLDLNLQSNLLSEDIISKKLYSSYVVASGESLSTVGKSIIDIIPIPDILTSKIPLLITNRAEDTVKGVLIMSSVDYKKKPESPASTSFSDLNF